MNTGVLHKCAATCPRPELNPMYASKHWSVATAPPKDIVPTGGSPRESTCQCRALVGSNTALVKSSQDPPSNTNFTCGKSRCTHDRNSVQSSCSHVCHAAAPLYDAQLMPMRKS